MTGFYTLQSTVMLRVRIVSLAWGAGGREDKSWWQLLMVPLALDTGMQCFCVLNSPLGHKAWNIQSVEGTTNFSSSNSWTSQGKSQLRKASTSIMPKQCVLPNGNSGTRFLHCACLFLPLSFFPESNFALCRPNTPIPTKSDPFQHKTTFEIFKDIHFLNLCCFRK